MTAKYPYRLSVIVTGLLIMLFASTAWAVPSKWTCGTGDYSTLTCWNPQLKEPPYNRGVLTFDVTIEADDSTISMDLDVVPCEVNSLILGTSKAVADHPATLKILGGKSYSVFGQTCIYGRIYANGGSFLAPQGSFCGNKAQVLVDVGGRVVVGTPSFDSTGLWASWDTDSIYDHDGVGTWSPVLMKASGEGSLLDLSSVQSIDASFTSTGNDHTYQQIVAEQGGEVDLSGVRTLAAPASGRDRLDVILKGTGAVIHLESLRDITSAYQGWYHGYGATRIENAGGRSLDLASLSSVDKVDFAASADSVIEIPTITTIADSTFVATGGARILSADSPATYSSLEIWRSWDTDSIYDHDGVGTWSPVLMKASGEGSLLDLSSVQSIDASFTSTGNDHTYQQIVAEQGGKINLSSVKTIAAPRRAETVLSSMSLPVGHSTSPRCRQSLLQRVAGPCPST